MQKLLILGGTNFIGRYLVERLAQYTDYKITLLNRVLTNSDLFSHLNRIKGDRNTPAISSLIKSDWDYIIDLSCNFPNALHTIIESLPSLPKKYIFISTCSVYEYQDIYLRDESADTQYCAPKDFEDNSLTTYGKRKSMC